MRKYLTSYPIITPDGVRTFSSYVWASDWDAAERMCVKRGIVEKVDGVTGAEAKDVRFDGKLSPAPSASKFFYHWLCFLSYVALKSGLIHMKDSIELVASDPTANYHRLLINLGFLPETFGRNKQH